MVTKLMAIFVRSHPPCEGISPHRLGRTPLRATAANYPASGRGAAHNLGAKQVAVPISSIRLVEQAHVRQRHSPLALARAHADRLRLPSLSDSTLAAV